MFVADAEFIFDANGQLYIKEFTLVQAEGNGEPPTVVIHDLIYPPCPWNQIPFKYQKRCRWVTRHFHHLPFEYGRITLTQLQQEIKKWIPEPGHVLFTKGGEKAYVFEETFGYPTVSLDQAPSIVEYDQGVICPFEHQSHCSKKKALFYARWLQWNPDQTIVCE